MGNTVDHEGGNAEQRARLALMRRFNGDNTAVSAAMETYDGLYPSMVAYVRRELEEHMPPFLDFLYDFLDLERLALDWIQRGRNWIVDDRATGEVHVFLSSDPLHPSR